MAQTMNVTTAMRDDDRNEISGHGVGEPLDRRSAALRLSHHVDDLRKERFGSHLLCAHDKRAGLVDRGADYAFTCALFDRHWLARDHRLVNVAPALDDHAVDRDFFSRSNAKQITLLDLIDGDLFFLTATDAVGGLRCETKQRLDQPGWFGCGLSLPATDRAARAR